MREYKISKTSKKSDQNGVISDVLVSLFFNLNDHHEVAQNTTDNQFSTPSCHPTDVMSAAHNPLHYTTGISFYFFVYRLVLRRPHSKTPPIHRHHRPPQSTTPSRLAFGCMDFFVVQLVLRGNTMACAQWT